MTLLQQLLSLISSLLGEEIPTGNTTLPQQGKTDSLPYIGNTQGIEGIERMPPEHQDLILFFLRIPQYYKGLAHQDRFLGLLTEQVEDSIAIWRNETESETETQDYRPNDIRSDNDVFDLALTFTLRWEGGYVNHPSDPGGATNKGVIQATYNEYRDRKRLPRQSVRSITDAEVHEIYHLMYWTSSLCEIMPPKLAVAMFDTAVNFGVGGAVMFLQDLLAVQIDGRFGPLTKEAYDRHPDKERLAFALVDARIQYRHLRVSQKPSQKVFLAGWLNRDNSLRVYIESPSL